jgi:hypothetical protein
MGQNQRKGRLRLPDKRGLWTIRNCPFKTEVSEQLYQPVALVGFCVILSRKNHDLWAALRVCNVKNRLVGDFLIFYAQSATNSY